MSSESKLLRICNVSNQMVSLQVSAAGRDFYRDQQQIHLQRNKDIQIESKYLVTDQIENLRQRGILKIISQNQ